MPRGFSRATKSSADLYVETSILEKIVLLSKMWKAFESMKYAVSMLYFYIMIDLVLLRLCR